MKKIEYICDGCGKNYPYTLESGQPDRGILQEVLGYDLCLNCVKEVKTLLANLKNSYNDNESIEIKQLGFKKPKKLNQIMNFDAEKVDKMREGN